MQAGDCGSGGDSVRAEKVFGFVGLGLFFLFPLVGLLQMSDGEATWRAVAARTADSVVRVETAAGAPVCGVVVARDPVRIVVAGAHPAVQTHRGGVASQWRAVHVDAASEFTILAAAGANPIGGAIAVDPARIGDLEALGDPGIETALVGPATEGGTAVVWLGELSVEHHVDRRPSFRAAALRPLRGDAALAATGAAAAASATTAAGGFDPALRGAPFVTRDGVVLALCAGQGEAGVRAVPMAHVREALSLLNRRADR
jgi:hypothetical protein